MFTWNFQYVSKARLADTFNQLMLNAQKGDILIRIHTSIHQPKEAMELAHFVKELVPRAQVFGTSTSAVINGGKLENSQCIVSVTQMDDGRLKTALLPVTDPATGQTIPAKTLCENVKEAVITEDTKLCLAFITGDYKDVNFFANETNESFPGVQMIGGVAAGNIDKKTHADTYGFLFTENGWSKSGLLVTSFSGNDLECFSSYVSGVQPVGKEMEVTETRGNCVVSLDGRDALGEYLSGVGRGDQEIADLTRLLPFVYSDDDGLPVQPLVKNDKLYLTHNVAPGRKIRRSFFYDREIVSENRNIFRHVENFEKAETLFGYMCSSRLRQYPNSVKWEASVYENSNLCGCIVHGEFARSQDRNVFANCSFVIAVFGEQEYVQEYNLYAFSHTSALKADNQGLIDYLVKIETRLSEDKKTYSAGLKPFLEECVRTLFYSDYESLPNEASMNMDMKLRGYDRICVISVLDVSSMKLVFSEEMIQITNHNFVSKCVNFAKKKNYRFYMLDQWQVAIGTPSYATSLNDFAQDMEKLHRELFESSEKYIAIVPIFCVTYNCTPENISVAYHSARVEMLARNMQFMVRDANEERLDEDSIRKKYHMVNVINYAIAHDKLIPYYQGIFDNKRQMIHHYEALMRLEDENGDIYYPNDFLDVARSFGLLYDSLSLIMIQKVFERFQNEEERAVSINIGMRDIKNPEVVDFIYESLALMKHPENFIFELLENEDVGDYAQLVTFVDKIHELGGLISIDDFGSGYSNLQQILSIHSDFIKIDGSIIRNCCVDKESENIIALITGWKSLSARNVKIVAEFVENEEIQQKLSIYNVDYSQGYLFSKPSPKL